MSRRSVISVVIVGILFILFTAGVWWFVFQAPWSPWQQNLYQKASTCEENSQLCPVNLNGDDNVRAWYDKDSGNICYLYGTNGISCVPLPKPQEIKVPEPTPLPPVAQQEPSKWCDINGPGSEGKSCQIQSVMVGASSDPETGKCEMYVMIYFSTGIIIGQPIDCPFPIELIETNK